MNETELPYRLAIRTTIIRYVKVVSSTAGETEDDYNKNDSTRPKEKYAVETIATLRALSTLKATRLTGVTYRSDDPLINVLEVFVTDPYGSRALVERQQSYREYKLDFLNAVHGRWLVTINDGLNLDV